MDGVAVEVAVRRGAEVILHVARSADVVGVRGTARELVEDRLKRLLHHVRKHVQAPAVRHADHDFLHAAGARVLDDAFQRRRHRLAAVETEALRAHVLAAKEALELLGFDDLVEDRLLACIREVDLGVAAFDPLLDEAALLQIVDVHVFDADMLAVIVLQHRDERRDRRFLETHHAAEIHAAVQRIARETVIFGGQLLGERTLGKAQRIELRRDYLFDTAQAQGTSNEEELMRAELHRELVQSILRRIDSALR
mgnify:CR=1 FL=1